MAREKPKSFGALRDEWKRNTPNCGCGACSTQRLMASELDKLIKEWEVYLRPDEVHDFVAEEILGEEPRK